METNTLIYFIIVLIFILIVGFLIAKFLGSCPHNWQEKGRYETTRIDFSGQTYKSQFYLHECTNCKKLKREYL